MGLETDSNFSRRNNAASRARGNNSLDQASYRASPALQEITAF